MADYTVPEFLGLLYELERNRRFMHLRRELERRYRGLRDPKFRQEAYIDSVLALLWESDAEPQSVLAGR